MPKKTKQQKPFAFIQDLNTLPEDILVVVGSKRIEDWKILLKKLHIKQNVTNEIVSSLEKDNIEDKGVAGFFDSLSIKSEKNFHANFLCIAEWPKKAGWVDYEVLIHELHHAVQMIMSEQKGMSTEREALAYAHENLFHTLRRKLDGIDKFEKVTL
jgi:hypothetical protein